MGTRDIIQGEEIKLIAWLKKFFVKEVTPTEFKVIHSVRGELTPGVLSLSLETVDQNGVHIPYPMDVLELKVTPKLRAIVNRVLLDSHSENDFEILTSWAKKHL